MLANFRASHIEIASRPREVPSLKRNPFYMAEDALKEPDREMVEPVVEKFTGPTRADRLAALEVTGILYVNERPIALVNGELRHKGDMVEGFRIEDIREKEIIVSDDKGIESVCIGE